MFACFFGSCFSDTAIPAHEENLTKSGKSLSSSSRTRIPPPNANTISGIQLTVLIRCEQPMGERTVTNPLTEIFNQEILSKKKK